MLIILLYFAVYRDITAVNRRFFKWGECDDQHEDCPTRAKRGQCDDEKMHSECPWSCHFCAPEQMGKYYSYCKAVKSDCRICETKQLATAHRLLVLGRGNLYLLSAKRLTSIFAISCEIQFLQNVVATRKYHHSVDDL